MMGSRIHGGYKGSRVADRKLRKVPNSLKFSATLEPCYIKKLLDIPKYMT